MPRFDPPDIDPALTQEAQSVVSEASAKMEAWLTEAFGKLESEFDQQLQSLESELEQQRKTFIQEEQQQAQAFIEQLRKLQSTTQHLTPLDPEQKQVIDELNVLVDKANQELTARNDRWRSFGEKTVAIAHTGIKTLVKGIL